MLGRRRAQNYAHRARNDHQRVPAATGREQRFLTRIGARLEADRKREIIRKRRIQCEKAGAVIAALVGVERAGGGEGGDQDQQ